jgi:hypothetical protein
MLAARSAANRSTLARYRSGAPLANSRDLLGIHKSSDAVPARSRPGLPLDDATPNRRLGARPVDVIIQHGFEDLLAVRRYLEFQRGQ